MVEALWLMENPTQLQLLQAAVFFSAGIAVGVGYDVCRAVRRCSGRTVQAAADLLIVCFAAALLFVLGMLVGEGQVRIFMVGCTALGAASYSTLCSNKVVPILCRVIRGCRQMVRWLKIPLSQVKNFINSIKNLFPKQCIWVKMNGYSFNVRQYGFRRTRKGRASENSHETDRMDGRHRDRCHDTVRRVEYSSSTHPIDGSGGIPRRADSADRAAER
ncbi:MAG: spore cortex biosynthesis protein YabQ [Oscillospiraceae bacterium]|nr:spore cortex biosynthesis protein YabQ [Oscillospiraceae bacterium]